MKSCQLDCRSGDVAIPVSTLGTSYVAATGGALATALGLNATVLKTKIHPFLLFEKLKGDDLT